MAEIIIVIEKCTKLGTIRKVPNSFRPCFSYITNKDILALNASIATLQQLFYWPRHIEKLVACCGCCTVCHRREFQEKHFKVLMQQYNFGVPT